MAIVMNTACPSCQQKGHDKSGNHLMVFDDGARYCPKAHWHMDGLPLYIPPGSEDPIMGMEISGTIKYTPEQFRALEKEGKLNSDSIRAVALSGMRGEDKWEVSTDKEREEMLSSQANDLLYFNGLKIRNLVDRHIPGQIAQLYNVRVGSNLSGQTERHYYPVYDLNSGQWKGAKCRTLPKDFRYSHLGWMWGDCRLFGQATFDRVISSGARADTLLLVGGECDAMAAQHMLTESKKGSKYEGQLSHVWSPTKGENALSEIAANKESIGRFKKIIVAFDDDETGNKMNKEVAQLFRGKTFRLQHPQGCKDPNDALKQGRGKEFVDAWWNPVDPFEGGVLASMNKFKDKAKEVPTMGLSWPWPAMNAVTYGIRSHTMTILGAGTGIGKTAIAQEIVFHLAYTHEQPVVVIELESQGPRIVRKYSGKLINKDLTAPMCSDKKDPDYTAMRDYTEEQANEAIDKMCADGRIYIGDLEGRKDVASVMEVVEEAVALGYRYFVIDNLTAFEHKGKDGKQVNKVDAIDETMKRMGTFKDENPVWIMILSHLNRPERGRVCHEQGGEVSMPDFRGAGSITFWADVVWGARRNTKADTLEDKCLTEIEALKSRAVGHKTGTKVCLEMDLDTGRLNQTSRTMPASKQETDDNFDFGCSGKKKPPASAASEHPF